MDKLNIKILETINAVDGLSSRSFAETENMGNIIIAERFSYLHKALGYIEPKYDQGKADYMNTSFQLSNRGKEFLFEQSKLHKLHVLSEIRCWITTVIAVAAFVLSIISIV